MKSKTILSLLGLSASLACALADTYNVNVAPGYTLFANQLDLTVGGTIPGANLLAATPLGTMLPNKSQILTWDGTTFFVGTKAGTPGSWAANIPINVGEAFYCHIPPTGSPLSIPFTGSASTTPTPISGFSPTTSYYLLGSQTYDPTPGATYNYYDITGYLLPEAGSALFRAKDAAPGGAPIGSVPPADPSEWNQYVYDGAAWHFGSVGGPLLPTPSEPEIYLGEGVWIGPPMGTIAGRVTDNNGHPKADWLIGLSDGSYTFTDGNGDYVFSPVAPGDYTVTQYPPCGWTGLAGDPLPVTVSGLGDVEQLPAFTVMLETGGANAGPDLAVTVIYVPDPGNPDFPCPNDTGYYSVHYYSKCGAVVPAGSTLNVTLSSYVAYGSVFNPAWSQTPPVGGGLATEGIGGGTFITGTAPNLTLNWTLDQLPVSAIGEIRIPITISSSVSTVPHHLTTLSTTAIILPPSSGPSDAYLSDNTYQRLDYTRCSYDPNDNTVEPAGCGPTGLINGNQTLTYTLQFQNLGSAPAFDVVVNDQLDPSLDPSTLKILGTSANYVFQLNGNQMTWTFPNIYLPDATDDAPGSHGFIIYQAQLLPGLADGTVITNQASVVFDKNPPVLTSITTNTITSDTMAVASFAVTPEPGSAGHVDDFTYTGGTPGVSFLWDFGPDAIPPTSTNMNPAGVVFPADGLRTINLQVSSSDCDATPASYLLSVGQPALNIASSISNQVVLSWQGDGYTLQQSGSLTDPISWATISPILSQIGATRFASLDATNAIMFFRLTDQP